MSDEDMTVRVSGRQPVTTTTPADTPAAEPPEPAQVQLWPTCCFCGRLLAYNHTTGFACPMGCDWDSHSLRPTQDRA